MDFHTSFTREVRSPEFFKLKGRCGKVPVSSCKGKNIADLVSNSTDELIGYIIGGSRVTHGTDGYMSDAYASANGDIVKCCG